jgi:putative SOS response-associated peptidase YedK
MCGRFVISSNDPFGLKYETSYNVVPSQLVPVKTKDNEKLMKWSYSPSWKKDINLINCRSETMNEKHSFKNAKRCVIFHNGWYEWKRKDTQKIPFYHYCSSNIFAGLYNEMGCLILTRNSIDQINHIHHRQPLLLEDEEISRYLEGENIFNSNANNNIKFHCVSKAVNIPTNNNSSLINEVNFS